MEKPYLQFSHPPPRGRSLLVKKAAEKNNEVLRTKTVQEHREMQETLADVRIAPPGMRFLREECGGVPCEWVWSAQGREDKVLLYIHGGSWAYGSLKTARAVGAMLCEETDCRVLVMEYRLAPEQPYPAALEDCSSVLRWLCERYAPQDIGVFGDSAGGNLILALLHRLRAQGRAFPRALGLASPATDLSEESALYKSGTDLLYTQWQGRERDIFSLYCGDHNRFDPQVSPVYGELEGFPPMLIHVGQDEPLCIDCDLFAAKAYQAGVEVTLKIWRGMFHDFTAVGRTLRESKRSMEEFGAFFKAQMGQE